MHLGIRIYPPLDFNRNRAIRLIWRWSSSLTCCVLLEFVITFHQMFVNRSVKMNKHMPDWRWQTSFAVAYIGRCAVATSGFGIFVKRRPSRAHPLSSCLVVSKLFTHLSPHALLFPLCELSGLSAPVLPFLHHTTDYVWHTMQLPMNLVRKLPFIRTISIVWHSLATSQRSQSPNPTIYTCSHAWPKFDEVEARRRSRIFTRFLLSSFQTHFRLLFTAAPCAWNSVRHVVNVTHDRLVSIKRLDFINILHPWRRSVLIDIYSILGARSLQIVHMAAASTTTEQIE